MEEENVKTKENVEFILGDFLKYDSNDIKFDTIIMGEILEHLSEPELFIKQASKLIKESGKLIVSVPFGINEHPDHKRTYYFLELFEQVNKCFKVIDVEFMYNKICMISVLKQNSENFDEVKIDEKMLLKIEKAFYEIDQDRSKRKKALKSCIEENKKLENNYNILEVQFKNVDKLRNKLEKEYNILESQLKNIDKIRNKLEEEKVNYIKKVNVLNDKLESLNKKYTVLSRSKLGKIQIKYWNQKKKIKEYIKKYIVPIKRIAKNSPFLCELVWKYRSKKIRNNKGVVTPKAKLTNKNQLPPNNIKYFIENTDAAFFDKIKMLLDKIPESNGGRYYGKHNYKIGIISDEFLFQSYKDAAEFIFITPDNWSDKIEKIDFLLVASAWRGLNEEWRGAAQENSSKRKLIYSIIEKCKNNNKIVVYYSKEDPPNYDRFVEIAKKCDYIFTTCEEVVDNYKKDCNNDKVFVLSFAINPLYHNPVGFRNEYKQNGAIFSGSWMSKYPDRQKNMKMLFDGVIESKNDLKIIDRNYNYTASNIYRYPKEYWRYISPSMDHTVLQKVHKLYNWALNINTVTKSKTMFANRAYELQAAGNLLISNYSVGVNSKLPMIYTVIYKDEIGRIMNGLSEEEIYRKQIDGIRSVMTNETCFDRVGELLSIIGLEPNLNQKKIIVVAESITDNIQEMFDRQSYKFKTLVEKKDFTEEIFEQSDMIAFFDENMDYDMFYLEDMSNGFKYTDCNYITKDCYYDGNNLIEGKEHDYVSIMRNKNRTLFWSNSFEYEQLINMGQEEQIDNGYSIDHFNYNNRNKVKNINVINDFKLSVIVPVYNNGRFLLGKAFNSLQRSSMFNKMEIILVDDGSTDGYTDKLVKYLEKNYSNVKAFLFNDGGSGTASRPRNKGVELASCKYVTYLDPDNEAVSDGYCQLYNEAIQGKYDVVVGNIVKITDDICKNAKYYNVFKVKYGSDIVINDMKKYMEKTKLSPMSIQAMVIKREIIINNNITQPVGAAGQDSLFNWEVYMNSNVVKAIDLTIHIYYAAVEGSTVNSIGQKYFNKCLLLEKPRREALQKYDLLDIYMKERYNYYFSNWILNKLSLAKKEEAEACVKIVYAMHKIYEDVYMNNNKLINDFVMNCNRGEYLKAYESLVN